MTVGAWDVFLRLLTFIVLLIVLATAIRWVVDGRRSRRHSAGPAAEGGRRSSRNERRVTR